MNLKDEESSTGTLGPLLQEEARHLLRTGSCQWGPPPPHLTKTLGNEPIVTKVSMPQRSPIHVPILLGTDSWAAVSTLPKDSAGLYSLQLPPHPLSPHKAAFLTWSSSALNIIPNSHFLQDPPMTPIQGSSSECISSANVVISHITIRKHPKKAFQHTQKGSGF